MTFKPIEYEFDYEGDFESLDSISILNAHLNFINLIVEVKNKVAPEAKLKIDVKGFKQGSLEIQHLVEIVVPVGIFAVNNYEVVKNIIEIFTDILRLKSAIGKEKPIHNEIGNNHVEVNVYGDGNTVIISKDAFDIYQNNPVVSKLMSEASKHIDDLPDVKSLDLKPKDSNFPSLKLDRTDLSNLNSPNPYLDEETNHYIYEKAVLYVRKADLNPKPGKVCKWQFIHKCRDITAIILDENFISLINKGTAFGQGYRLIADMKAHKVYDKRVGTFIENKKYDILHVHKILPREDTQEADL